MLIDKNNMFHDDTAVTSAAEYKGDSLDVLESDKLDREGRGEPMEVIVQITASFAGGTDCKFETITAPEATLATDQVQYASPTIPTAQLVAGRKIRLPVHLAEDDTFEYFGVMATSTGVHTAGAFSAWLQRVGEDQNSYGA